MADTQGQGSPNEGGKTEGTPSTPAPAEPTPAPTTPPPAQTTPPPAQPTPATRPPAASTPASQAQAAARPRYVSVYPKWVRVIRGFLYGVLALIEILLAFRFFFLLFGANLDSSFTQNIYDWTDWLVAPFESVFGVTENTGNVFDPNTLLAMLVYAILIWGLVAILQGLTKRRRE